MLRPGRETFVVLLLATAFLVRLAAVVSARDITAGPGEVVPSHIRTDDDVQFNDLAMRVATGQGYVKPTWEIVTGPVGLYRIELGGPTSFRAPGWPILLAGVYKVAGEQPRLVYLLNCVLGALGAWLTYLLGRELLDEAGARLAGMFAALYVPSIWFATKFLSENLFVPLLALTLWLFVRGLRAGSGPLWALAVGLVLGWAVLTRPFALLMVPLLTLIVLAAAKGRRWVPAVVLPAAVLVVVLPWTVRNYIVHRQPVLVATNGGSTFYGGNNDRVASFSQPRLLGSWVSTTELPHRDRIEAAPNEVAHDKVEWQLGAQWVRDNPERALLMVPFKVARLVLWLPDLDGARPIDYAMRAAGYLPFLVLMLIGAGACVSRRLWSAPWLAVHATILATVVTAVVFWGSPRFRDANAPLLMLYAALGFQVAARFVHREQQAPAERAELAPAP
jgi:4-amino-4-deoxy-L-arabinose transferase-like glycosyltransferase